MMINGVKVRLTTMLMANIAGRPAHLTIRCEARRKGGKWEPLEFRIANIGKPEPRRSARALVAWFLGRAWAAEAVSVRHLVVEEGWV